MSLFGGNKPGGLSINTGSANSLFSSNTASSQPPAAGGLFGNSTADSKPAGGLFGATSTSTAASAGTLFGASTATTTQGGGGMFGNTLTAPASTSSAGTLFGGAAASQGGLFGNKPATPQPAATGGLFGASQTQQPAQGGQFGSTQPQQQQPQQQQGPNLFGSTQNTQPGGSLFGPQPAQPAQTGGLFGMGATNAQPQQQAGGLFGAQNANTSLFNTSTQPTQNPQKPNFSQTTSTLFPPQNPQRSAFSASIGQYTAAAQTVPGVRIDISNLRSTTRFEDLHESLQQEIAGFDEFITRQMDQSAQCAGLNDAIDNLSNSITPDVAYLERKLKAVEHSLQTDAATIEEGRALVKRDAGDARRSFKAIHALKMPSQYHVSGPWSSSTSAAAGALGDGDAAEGEKQGADLVRYFSKQAEEMDAKLKVFKNNLAEVEYYLAGVEAQTMAKVQSARMGQAGDNGPKSAEEKVRELAGVLREFEGGILTVASAVGGVREQVQEVILNDSKVGRWGRR